MQKGKTVTTITTKTTTKYTDGSSSTKTEIKTITKAPGERKMAHIDPVTGKATGEYYSPEEAMKKAPKAILQKIEKFLSESNL